MERAVAIAARQILNDRAVLLEALETAEIESPEVRATLELTANFSRRLEKYRGRCVYR
jgi:hypothetical protein